MISLEDAQFLGEMLSNTFKALGQSSKVWYVNDDAQLRVAEILEDECLLTTAKDAIYFFEKPYKYENAMQTLVEEAFKCSCLIFASDYETECEAPATQHIDSYAYCDAHAKMSLEYTAKIKALKESLKSEVKP